MVSGLLSGGDDREGLCRTTKPARASVRAIATAVFQARVRVFMGRLRWLTFITKGDSKQVDSTSQPHLLDYSASGVKMDSMSQETEVLLVEDRPRHHKNGRMAKKKPDAHGEKRDRHKPSRMLRIPKILIDQLDALALKNVTNPTQEAIRAIREYLERNNLWPPQV